MIVRYCKSDDDDDDDDDDGDDCKSDDDDDDDDDDDECKGSYFKLMMFSGCWITLIILVWCVVWENSNMHKNDCAP